MFKLGIDFQRVHPRIYTQHETNKMTLVETSSEGQATVTFILPASRDTCNYYELHAEHQSLLEKIVPNNNCCDGIFLMATDEQVDIYLVELKTNIGVKTWEKVQKQFH